MTRLVGSVQMGQIRDVAARDEREPAGQGEKLF